MDYLIIILSVLIAYYIGRSISSRSLPSQSPKREIIMTMKGIKRKRSSREVAQIDRPDVFDLTSEKQQVLDLLECTNRNILLTGRAGTGKSNFLKYFRTTTKKNIVVLAFTGVASVNVQGQTIHSFFKFNPQTTLDSIQRRWGNSTSIYKNINTIVIDEISMVRADLLDFIDKFMRLNGKCANEPFGGVQILAIGDLFQLPPIVGRSEEEYFSKVYRSPYFFDSYVYNTADFKKLELTEVYRQDSSREADFINALDKIRDCSFEENDIELINTRYDPYYEKPYNESIISLVPTNKLAQAMNMNELSKLPSNTCMYSGVLTGDFNEGKLPTELDLTLKEGAQVMLLNNDPQQRWINGDIVKILETNPDSVRVLFEDGTYDDVLSNKWESIVFKYNEDNNIIQPEVIGTFTQLPLRLAWAVTIHKGQGKSFNKVHIDFGHGTFAPGQAYVALSRCRSINGLVITTPLASSHVFTDQRIKRFMDS